MPIPTHQLLLGAATCMTIGFLQFQFPPNELPSLTKSNYSTPKYLDYALLYTPIETGYDIKAATDGWRWMKDNRLFVDHKRLKAYSLKLRLEANYLFSSFELPRNYFSLYFF